MRCAATALLLLTACKAAAPEPVGPSFVPGTVYATPEAPGARGLLDRRGLIHAHSVYSHDACDSEPVKEGRRDPECFEDFRRGLCQARHDFVMLTDHRDAFSATDFPENLLYRPDRGDRLVEHDGRPTASWAACPQDRAALILAGAESATMPVGLEEHVASRAERSDIYGSKEPAAIEMLKAHGAVSLVQHTETWTTDELSTLPIDGFEMFNLHANSFQNLGGILELVLRLQGGDFTGMGHPDLAVIGFISEDPRYLKRWGTVLSRGVRRVTTMGTDCHRNSFPAKLQDGERVDSYRRMMIWLSNHLLVRPDADGTWNDRHLKEALRSGRLYGAFDMLGYPEGFDYHARIASDVFEMGDEIQLTSAPELRVVRPGVQGLSQHGLQPEITLHILRAIPNGWREHAVSSEAMLTFTPTTAGAYRAEVRMVPHHLEPHLGDDAQKLLEESRPWVYGNAIYVR